MRIEFEITGDTEKILQKVHEEYKKDFPQDTLTDTINRVWSRALFYDPKFMDHITKKITEALVGSAVDHLKNNPEAFRQVMEMFKHISDKDAAKWAKDRVIVNGGTPKCSKCGAVYGLHSPDCEDRIKRE